MQVSHVPVMAFQKVPGLQKQSDSPLFPVPSVSIPSGHCPQAPSPTVA